MKQINIGDFIIGDNVKFVLIAGPCVLENEAVAMDTARYLQKLTAKLKIPCPNQEATSYQSDNLCLSKQCPKTLFLLKQLNRILYFLFQSYY